MLKRIADKIPAHTSFFLKFYLVQLALFTSIRSLFYFINAPLGNKVSSVTEILHAFKRGWEFDTSVFCWIAMLPFLLFSIGIYASNKKKLFSFAYTLFVVFLIMSVLTCCADIPYYSQFGNHLNKNAFLWDEDPLFVLRMIFASFSYWGYLLFFMLFSLVLILFAKRFYKKFIKESSSEIKPRSLAMIIVIVAEILVMTIGARGRIFDRSGLHEGLSIVSQDPFINQIAINPNFSFWRSVFFEGQRKKYQVPADIEEKIAFTRKYLNIQTTYNESIERKVEGGPIKPYNFVIVIMESMSVFKMGYYNGKDLTPYLNKLAKESVYFDNFFSSGIHTFNGLFSTISGYPSIYSEKATSAYTKRSFSGLGTLLKAQGYDTYAYTTHDPHFDNLQGFYTLNGFDHFISEYDFDASQTESSLGIPDHLLFDKLIEVTNSRKNNKPFLSVLLTASDHGPWKIPANIPFEPDGENEKEDCTLYADWAIGQFMENAKKTPWYNNTVFLFLGDHGVSLGHTYEMPIAFNHIPFIIHQPALFKADTISYPAYQEDVPATVMGINGNSFTNNTFGINVLKEKHPYVVFSADDKVGCVDSSGYYYYTTLSNGISYLRKYKNLDTKNYVLLMKDKAQEMKKQMWSIYETARFFVERDYKTN